MEWLFDRYCIKKQVFHHRRVFVRADMNVSFLPDGSFNTFKLDQLLPTLRYIQNQGGKIILATHLGRPEYTHLIDETVSTKRLIPWFEKHQFSIEIERDLKKAVLKSYENFSSILLLENLRFFQGEQEPSLVFAEVLASLADCYVNDAYGLIHRDNTSVTLLAQQFPPSRRSIGLLMEKELTTLGTLMHEPAQPYMMLMGGAKLSDKIKLLEHLLLQATQHKKPHTIIIGGALAYSFLYAQGIEVGTSLVDKELAPTCMRILEQARAVSVDLVLPLDHVIRQSDGTIHTSPTIPPTGQAIDIGEKTITLFTTLLRKARTIFVNGTLGLYSDNEGKNGTESIWRFLATCSAQTIIGGGDAATAAHLFNLADKIDFISTGGGATLAVLATSRPAVTLPALAMLFDESLPHAA